MIDNRADLARRLIAIGQYLRTIDQAIFADALIAAATELRRPTVAEVDEIIDLWNETRCRYDIAVRSENDAVVWLRGRPIPYIVHDAAFHGTEEQANRFVDRQCAAALLRRLPPAPADAEAIKRDFDTIEVFLGEAENYELADDSTVDITGPFDAMERIRGLVRRLSPADEGWRPTHRHYKGGLYRVVARGKLEADLSPVVIYDNAKGETWVRPSGDFAAAVDTERGCVFRFDPLPAPP